MMSGFRELSKHQNINNRSLFSIIAAVKYEQDSGVSKVHGMEPECVHNR